MKLIKIRGNTHYIPSVTNIGVYTFKSKECILVDTGINNTIGRRIEKVLTTNDLRPKYIINTHSHLDHCGGNNYITEKYPGCITYASSMEKLFMENIDLYPYTLYGAYPAKGIKKTNKSINVDYNVTYGINKINDEKIEIIPLMGHSIEQIGVITPEKVCFVGDSIFSMDIMEKYSLPYLYNIEDTLETLEYMKEIDADIFVISHSDKLYSKEEMLKLIDKNIELINTKIDECLEILETPHTKEELLESMIILNDIKCFHFNQYHIYLAAIAAFTSYLYNKDYIESYIENGKLYYYKK